MTGSASYYEVKFSDTTKPNGQIWAGVVGDAAANAPRGRATQRWFVVWLGTANNPVDKGGGQGAGRVDPAVDPAAAATAAAAPARRRRTRTRRRRPPDGAALRSPGRCHAGAGVPSPADRRRCRECRPHAARDRAADRSDSSAESLPTPRYT